MKIYAPHEDAPDFVEFGYDRQAVEKYRTAVAAWVKRVVAYAKKHGKGKLRGEIISFPVGDGEARYVVLSAKELIHMNDGDGYIFPYANRLTSADVRTLVERTRTFNNLFGAL